MTVSRRPSGDDHDPECDDFDPELFERYQEYQRFREFERLRQRQGADPPEATPPAHRHTGDRSRHDHVRRPLWLMLLDNWFTRKIVGVLVWLVALAIVAYLLLSHFFPSRDPEVLPNGERNPGGPNAAAPTFSPTPREAVRAFHQYLGYNDPKACTMLNETAKHQFAESVGAADCAAARESIATRVTDRNLYSNPVFSGKPPADAAGPVVIDSCSITASGGPALGTFTVGRERDNAWRITGYATGGDCGGNTVPTSP